MPFLSGFDTKSVPTATKLHMVNKYWRTFFFSFNHRKDVTVKWTKYIGINKLIALCNIKLYRSYNGTIAVIISTTRYLLCCISIQFSHFVWKTIKPKCQAYKVDGCSVKKYNVYEIEFCKLLDLFRLFRLKRGNRPNDMWKPEWILVFVTLIGYPFASHFDSITTTTLSHHY